MAYMSLYRKWRPQTFEEIIGQKFVVRTLANALKAGKYTHAYLFAGPRGTGKTSTARILAKALNCVDGPTPHPCNVCESCRRISEGSALDVVEIDAASNRGIDDVRELRERVVFSPAQARLKVYIIDEVHMLSEPAFNALLKMLEEPPSHVVFVLATTEPHKVLQTILSRCQRFDFRRVGATEISRHLGKVAQEEGLELEEKGAMLIARSAQGSVRDALVMLDQIASYADGRITAEEVAGFLGSVSSELFYRLCDLVMAGDGIGLLKLAGELEEQGKDLGQFVREAVEFFRKLFLLQNTDAGAEFLELTEEEYLEVKRRAEALTPRQVAGYIELLQEVGGEMRNSGLPRMVLEMGLVRMARPEAEFAPLALASRIDKLEERLDNLTRWEGSSAEGVEQRGALSSPEETAGASTSARRVSSGEGVGIDLSQIKRSWSKIRERVKEKDIPTYYLLMDSQPVGVKGGELLLKFHPTSKVSYLKMGEEGHKAVVEESLREVLRMELRLQPVLESEGSRERVRKEPGLPLGPGSPSAGKEIKGSKPKGTAREMEEVASGEEPVVEEVEVAEEAGEKEESGHVSIPSPGSGLPEKVEKPSEKVERKRVEGDKVKSGTEETHEVHRVRMVRDIFGAEVVEEIHIQQGEELTSG